MNTTPWLVHDIKACDKLWQKDWSNFFVIGVGSRGRSLYRKLGASHIQDGCYGGHIENTKSAILIMLNKWLDWVKVFTIGWPSKETWRNTPGFWFDLLFKVTEVNVQKNYKDATYCNCWGYWPETVYICTPYVIWPLPHQHSVRYDSWLDHYGPETENTKCAIIPKLMLGWISSKFVAWHTTRHFHFT
jgi:hypothetical protein